jgi:hypothetical protein
MSSGRKFLNFPCSLPGIKISPKDEDGKLSSVKPKQYSMTTSLKRNPQYFHFHIIEDSKLSGEDRDRGIPKG